MRRGFTLLETVVAAALLALTFGLAAGYLIPAMRVASRANARIEQQQQATTALNRLEFELRKSSVAGVTLHSAAPVRLAINPLERVSADGTLVWTARYLIYAYDGPSRRLLRREWPPGTPPATPDLLLTSKPKRLPTALLEALPLVSTVTLATGVTSFQILHEGSSDGIIVQPMRFVIELERESSAQRRANEKLIYSRSVFLPGMRS